VFDYHRRGGHTPHLHTNRLRYRGAFVIDFAVTMSPLIWFVPGQTIVAGGYT
jgi:hypothetical protein